MLLLAVLLALVGQFGLALQIAVLIPQRMSTHEPS
jgi:hypothetical protein